MIAWDWLNSDSNNEIIYKISFINVSYPISLSLLEYLTTTFQHICLAKAGRAEAAEKKGKKT